MITAEEFFGFISGEIAYPPDFVHRTAIEFAKLHVQAALKAASEKSYIQIDEHELSCSVDKKSILNSYSLENIK